MGTVPQKGQEIQSGPRPGEAGFYSGGCSALIECVRVSARGSHGHLIRLGSRGYRAEWAHGSRVLIDGELRNVVHAEVGGVQSPALGVQGQSVHRCAGCLGAVGAQDAGILINRNRTHGRNARFADVAPAAVGVNDHETRIVSTELMELTRPVFWSSKSVTSRLAPKAATYTNRRSPRWKQEESGAQSASACGRAERFPAGMCCPGRDTRRAGRPRSGPRPGLPQDPTHTQSSA